LRFSDLETNAFPDAASLRHTDEGHRLNAAPAARPWRQRPELQTNSSRRGGESLDVILDASDTAAYPRGNTFYLYTRTRSPVERAENFGGLMTEVHICSAWTRHPKKPPAARLEGDRP